MRLDRFLFLDSNAMSLDQKQLSSPVLPLRVSAQICKQVDHDRWKGLWVVSHLKGNNAAEVCRRIINNVSEIAVESHEHGMEVLRAVYHVRIFRVYWQVTPQQLNRMSGVMK
jgi:hypothetical protein